MKSKTTENFDKIGQLFVDYLNNTKSPRNIWDSLKKLPKSEILNENIINNQNNDKNISLARDIMQLYLKEAEKLYDSNISEYNRIILFFSLYISCLITKVIFKNNVSHVISFETQSRVIANSNNIRAGFLEQQTSSSTDSNIFLWNPFVKVPKTIKLIVIVSMILNDEEIKSFFVCIDTFSLSLISKSEAFNWISSLNYQIGMYFRSLDLPVEEFHISYMKTWFLHFFPGVINKILSPIFLIRARCNETIIYKEPIDIVNRSRFITKFEYPNLHYLYAADMKAVLFTNAYLKMIMYIKHRAFDGFEVIQRALKALYGESHPSMDNNCFVKVFLSDLKSIAQKSIAITFTNSEKLLGSIDSLNPEYRVLLKRHLRRSNVKKYIILNDTLLMIPESNASTLIHNFLLPAFLRFGVSDQLRKLLTCIKSSFYCTINTAISLFYYSFLMKIANEMSNNEFQNDIWDILVNHSPPYPQLSSGMTNVDIPIICLCRALRRAITPLSNPDLNLKSLSNAGDIIFRVSKSNQGLWLRPLINPFTNKC